MSLIKEIQTPDGVIYVEMQEVELPETLELQPKMLSGGKGRIDQKNNVKG